MGELSHNDIKTGVVYGFLKDIVYLKDRFNTDRIAFCFESGKSKRKAIYPEYKQHRHSQEHTPEEEAARAELMRQIKELRDDYLPSIGFRNIFSQKGYESDDIIAMVARNMTEGDECVIVSADKDMYQLLSPRVCMYNPNAHKLITHQTFYKEKRIEPRLWANVLSMTGCDTDEVEGIRGIGEKTAIKYLLSELKETSVAFEKITSKAGRRIRKRNRKLVCLPFEGTVLPELRDDEFNEDNWKSLCKRLGMRTLRDIYPMESRRAMRSNYKPAGFNV